MHAAYNFLYELINEYIRILRKGIQYVGTSLPRHVHDSSVQNATHTFYTAKYVTDIGL